MIEITKKHDVSLYIITSLSGALKIAEHVILSDVIDIDQESSDYDRTRALWWAIKEEQHGCMELLLEHGASQCPLNVYGDSAVYTAAYYQKREALKTLLDHGCTSIPKSKDKFN